MDVCRTPDDRFEGLPGWDHEPHYLEWDGLRLARVEAGPAEAHAVVLLHGEPTWGYLYRDVIPPLVTCGNRVVVPDLPGFGRSDKPVDPAWYSFDRLYDAVDAHLSTEDLADPFTLVVHDWGGALGLPWAIDHPDRVRRLVILDTALYAPGGTPSEAWKSFRAYVEQADELPVAALVAGGCATELDDRIAAAYEAPFHEPRAHAGALRLPVLVPLEDDDPVAQRMWAANRALGAWDRPTLIIWGEDDPILPVRIGRRWADSIPGCVGMETLSPAGHFLQEDAGEEVGRLIARFAAGT